MKRLYLFFSLGLLVLSAATGYSMPQQVYAQLSSRCPSGYTFVPSQNDPTQGMCRNNTNGSNIPVPTVQPNSGGQTSGSTGSNSGGQTSGGSGSNSGGQTSGGTTSNSGGQTSGGSGSNSGGQSQAAGCKPNDTACQQRKAAEDACSAKRDQGYVLVRAFGNDSSGYGRCMTIFDFFQTLINYFLMFASIIAGIMFARGAYGILTSRGTPQAVSEARETLTNAVIGLVLIAIAFVVIKFLNGAFSTIDGSINLLGPFVQ